MKVYFIFELKKEFVKLYRGNESVLYHILRQIYYLDKSEVEFGYHLFNQLTVPINKKALDREIFIKFHQDIPYSKRKDVHYINNLYKDEVSRLVVRKSYIRLELEQRTSTFFEILKTFSDTYFVCCFTTHECFFLTKESKSEVCIKSPLL